jgi:FHA domain
MIVCLNCKHKNMVGALFCRECGAPLNVADVITTQHIATAPVKEREAKKSHGHPAAPIAINQWVTLHLLDTGQVLPLAERNEFTLGRISEGQSIMPDIDLSPYQAYASGVSRLHAIIKRDADHVMLMDLGSSNGTFINGKRLNPNMEHALNNGDVVALGKLKLQILLKAAP